MAEGREDKSKEDLTEEASPHRLEEYRRKGMVAQSRELSGLLALLASGMVITAMSPKMGAQLTDFMKEVFRTDLSSRLDLGSPKIAGNYLLKAVRLMISLGLPICLAGFVMGAVGSFVQIGSIFSFDPLTPDFEKIDPIQGTKRLFSLKNLIEGARLIFKMIVIVSFSYYLVKSQIFQSGTYFGSEAAPLVVVLGTIAKNIFFPLIGALFVFSAIDFGFQKYEYNKNLRMTKQEAKQEHKERDGDPQIRARIRAVQREMSRKRMMQAVKKADVIVTNPTHIAIALVYDKNSMSAPKVVAKGADFLAQRIKEVAKNAGVPLVENVPLARTLYKTVKVGQNIPRALYQAVAEVLAYVYKLKRGY